MFRDLRTLIGSKYVFRVCVLDLQTTSAMYTLGSWLEQSDEIRLYANDMQRSYAEYGTETRIEPTEGTGIYSLVCRKWVRNFWLYKWSNTFNGVNTDVINVCLETVHSISDEICIITNNL